MTPEKRRRAEAISALIRMGWSPPRPSDEITHRILDDICAISADDRRRDDNGLTEKELDVLELLSRGDTRYDIADRLCISSETVKKRIDIVKEKLGARNTAHAVAIGVQTGLVEMREAA